MHIEVRVIPNARKRAITRVGSQLKVKLISQPHDGKANEELVEYLSGIFGVKRSAVRIVRGEKERNKVVSIDIDEAALETLNVS
ncbi:MAG TPA: DUF167 domain-containing protein [Syntrophorhabdaceae bacterium]|nr:DUF167 domain-containing protein [Syntrophorhabdaceae bacterium]HQM80701.1 DUF167 domain-containing protein [Syntrophorhabdaceae bacterium]